MRLLNLLQKNYLSITKIFINKSINNKNDNSFNNFFTHNYNTNQDNNINKFIYNNYDENIIINDFFNKISNKEDKIEDFFNKPNYD
jgi:hypothetical protein